MNATKRWLLARLAAGPVPSAALHADAVAAGFSRFKLFRARARLIGKIRTRKTGGHGAPWVWELEPRT